MVAKATQPKSNGTPTKSEVAQSLARRHFRLEGTIRRIVRLLADDERERDPREPIKLLEVNDLTPALGIFPIPQGVTAGVPYPTTIIEVTPAEFADIRRGELALPQGWTLGPEYKRRRVRKAARR